MPEKEKYGTYIDGLDDLIGGGIPRNHIVLVSGGAGTMKSSISYAILHNNAMKKHVKSLYISLEQSRESILRHMTGMGFIHEETNGLVEILDMGLLRRKMESEGKLWMDIFMMYVQKIKETNDYKILVIDSIDVLEILAKFKNQRVELFKLFNWLKQLRTTVVLISEIPHIYALSFMEQDGLDLFSRNKESYLVDGVIHLKMEKKGEFEIQRRIRCAKMRGTKHSTDAGILAFENGKFHVMRTVSD